jgi:hypothetical protein
MTPSIVRYTAVAARCEEEHLILKIIAIKGPSMGENDLRSLLLVCVEGILDFGLEIRSGIILVGHLGYPSLCSISW